MKYWIEGDHIWFFTAMPLRCPHAAIKPTSSVCSVTIFVRIQMGKRRPWRWEKNLIWIRERSEDIWNGWDGYFVLTWTIWFFTILYFNFPHTKTRVRVFLCYNYFFDFLLGILWNKKLISIKWMWMVYITASKRNGFSFSHQLEERVREWQESPSAATCLWFTEQPGWVELVASALKFLSGDVLGEFALSSLSERNHRLLTPFSKI